MPLQYPNVLVTGAAGFIGRYVARELKRRGHTVRGFDINPMPELPDGMVGDLAKMADVQAAVAGMNAIVHLGATPWEQDFMTQLLPNNIVGVYNVFEAARLAGIKRVVATSSIQVVSGCYGKRRPVRVEDGYHPVNWYGCTKVFQEMVGKVYATQHGMSVIVPPPGPPPAPRRAAGGPGLAPPAA